MPWFLPLEDIVTLTETKKIHIGSSIETQYLCSRIVTTLK